VAKPEDTVARSTCSTCNRRQRIRIAVLKPGPVKLYECIYCGARDATGPETGESWKAAQKWINQPRRQKLRFPDYPRVAAAERESA